MTRPGSKQKGSALVTVLGISALLTVAAGGLLATSSMSQTEEDMAWNRTQCFYSLESGMMLGARWLRATNNWIGFTTFPFDVTPVNNCPITVTVVNASELVKRIEARHEDGANTIRLACDVTTPDIGAGPGRPVRISNWRILDGRGP